MYLALELARQFGSDGPSLEIIDLRSIVPFDERMIYASVRKTNRVVIVHEDILTMGFGAEIATRIDQNCFSSLDAPVLRVAARDSFVPPRRISNWRCSHRSRTQGRCRANRDVMTDQSTHRRHVLDLLRGELAPVVNRGSVIVCSHTL